MAQRGSRIIFRTNYKAIPLTFMSGRSHVMGVRIVTQVMTGTQGHDIKHIGVTSR